MCPPASWAALLRQRNLAVGREAAWARCLFPHSSCPKRGSASTEEGRDSIRGQSQMPLATPWHSLGRQAKGHSLPSGELGSPDPGRLQLPFGRELLLLFFFLKRCLRDERAPWLLTQLCIPCSSSSSLSEWRSVPARRHCSSSTLASLLRFLGVRFRNVAVARGRHRMETNG